MYPIDYFYDIPEETTEQKILISMINNISNQIEIIDHFSENLCESSEIGLCSIIEQISTILEKNISK